MTDDIDWVLTHLPAESAKALAHFAELNHRLVGIRWDDALEILIDTDCHLDITDPIHQLIDSPRPGLVRAVAITLLYADPAFDELNDNMRAVAVSIIIEAQS